MKTLLLDQATWDLTKDASGNIAVADRPYAIAQDVASATRVFLGEIWYDTRLGVPYFEQILGKAPPLEFIKAQLAAPGLTVPNVVDVQVFITGFVNRGLSGQLVITDDRGLTAIVGFMSLDELPWYINAAISYPVVI